ALCLTRPEAAPRRSAAAPRARWLLLAPAAAALALLVWAGRPSPPELPRSDPAYALDALGRAAARLDEARERSLGILERAVETAERSRQ
ncbi:MAG TPA: hypothetical protein VFU47_06075, partial [Armatimonadota bacterium]|nr:hypothetical protein [Armatimonadota bacterium]